MCDNSLNVWQAPDLLVRDGEEQAGMAWAAMAQDLLTAGRNPSPGGNETKIGPSGRKSTEYGWPSASSLNINARSAAPVES